MKKIIATALVAAAMSSTAYAADLGARKPSAPIIPIVPVFTWTGFYVGVNAGYSFSNSTRFTTLNDAGAANGVPTVRPGLAGLNSDGFTGGGQIGYNYQFGQSFGGGGFVVGVEADIAYTDISRTTTFVVGGRQSRFNASTDFIGTVRGRVGYAFDRFLVYGTGGFAYADVTQNTNLLDPTNTVSAYAGRRSTIDTGYAVGGGIEYALPTDSFLNFTRSSAVTLKAEYLYYDLGTSTLLSPSTAAGPGGTYTHRITNNGNLVRAGLNYKF